MRTRSRINLAGRLRSGVQQSPLPPPPPPIAAPVAAFTGTPLSGAPPLAVAFTDASTGTITSRTFTFGDGNTTGDKVGNHTYAAGTYSPALTVNGPGGTNTLTRTNYVSASSAPPGQLEYFAPLLGFVFTDALGTVPATAGQTVKSVLSAAGTLAVFSGAGYALETSGGKYWLTGDGLQTLDTAAIYNPDASKDFWVALSFKPTLAGEPYFFAIYDPAQDNGPGRMVRVPGDQGTVFWQCLNADVSFDGIGADAGSGESDVQVLPTAVDTALVLRMTTSGDAANGVRLLYNATTALGSCSGAAADGTNEPLLLFGLAGAGALVGRWYGTRFGQTATGGFTNSDMASALTLMAALHP